MTTTEDINTTGITAAAIKDDKHLCDVVYQLAELQLLLNSAQAEMQARMEAAKKAFADATADKAEKVKELFASVEAYAAEHRDRLFPEKGGKRKKTFKVLSHKLQYRSSDQVKAPANAVEIIKQLMQNTDNGPLRGMLNGVVRYPEPELNKDAVKTLPAGEARDLLHAHGITIQQLETFKLAFSFTPDEADA